MRKYLSKFNSVAEATAFEGELVAPHVSYVENGLAFSGNLAVDTPVKISLNAAGKLEVTVVPAPVEGPADNEIWYTTVDGVKMEMGFDYSRSENYFGTELLSNSYENNKGVLTFKEPVTVVKKHDVADSWPFTDPETESSTLKTIVLPNSVTSIGSNTFYGCGSLTSVTIPNSLTSIGNYVFSGCTSLTSIIFEGTMEEWNSITQGSDWNWNTFVPATHVQCSDGQVTL